LKEIKVYRNGEWVAFAEFPEPQATEWIEEGKREQWWGDPQYLTFEVRDISFECELRKVIELRKSEYPTFEEFLNAFFDESESGIEKLRQKRIEVKLKYPKPNQTI
jgi:hypothetical protein